MTYQIFRADSPEQLETVVNAHIEVGWRPLGGVITAQVRAEPEAKQLVKQIWAQPMVIDTAPEAA